LNERTDYRINYVRNAIIGLSMKHKPVIVSGIYYYNQNLTYSTFLNIKPYKKVDGKVVATKQICNHISVWNEFVEPYMDLTVENDKHRFYLICEAYTYETDGVTRGGLKPTEKLGVTPILPFEEEEKLKDIPQDEYIDFFDFADGKYAWVFGEPFIDKKLIKRREKYLRRKNREIEKEEPEIQLNTLSNGIVIPECPLNVSKYSTKYKKAFQLLDESWYA